MGSDATTDPVTTPVCAFGEPTTGAPYRRQLIDRGNGNTATVTAEVTLA